MINYPHMIKTLLKTVFYFWFFFYGFRPAESTVFSGVLTK